MSNPVDEKHRFSGDEDLKFVRACQKGDIDAFDVLVLRHQKKMFNTAYRILGDYDEAADVTQEAFIAAYKAIRTFKAEAKFSTWLYRIVLNHVQNRLKRLRGKKGREILAWEDMENLPLKDLSQHDANPDAVLEQKEKDAWVQQGIASLDEEYREILVLRDIQGLSYEEIRDILNVAEGTVKSRLSRARNALKDCLVKSMGDL